MTQPTKNVTDVTKNQIQELLNEEITLFTLKGKGACNDAYYIETLNEKLIVKSERIEKEFQPQNSLLVEAAVARQFSSSGLAISTPNVRFESKKPDMYGYDYIDGDLMANVWKILQEAEKISICESLGAFHAEIGTKITKINASQIGVQIHESVGLHPEVEQEYIDILSDPEVSEDVKTLAQKARNIFDNLIFEPHFQFLHNDAHHENILINDNVISGIIDFGEAEYGEITKEFSRYIRDYPDYFQHIVTSYESVSGQTLSRKRLITYSFLSGLIDNVEAIKNGGEKGTHAINLIAKYRRLMKDF